MRKLLAGGVAFLFVALLSAPAAPRGNDTLRQVQDRAQIEKLMWQYIRALDTENPDAYAAVYTPDGQFGSGPNAVKGRDALKKMIVDLQKRAADAQAETRQKTPPMYHVIANSYLEFTDKDHAHMEAYWMTVFAQAGPNVPVRVAAAGREVDELVRLDGQWLIKFRDVAPKD
jgi:uncharacterized protein (TIGR02246 family)